MAKELVDKINDLMVLLVNDTTEGDKLFWKEGTRFGDYLLRANAGSIYSSETAMSICDSTGRRIELFQVGEDSMLDHNYSLLRKAIAKSMGDRKADLGQFIVALATELRNRD